MNIGDKPLVYTKEYGDEVLSRLNFSYKIPGLKSGFILAFRYLSDDFKLIVTGLIKSDKGSK